MNPFAILGLPERFSLDVAALERTHRELSRALHPDRHAQSGPEARRTALHRAVEVNEAHRVVRDPVRRAEALFALAGLAVGEGVEPKASPALLMDVMERRESLAEAKAKGDLNAVAFLEKDVERWGARLEDALRRALDEHEAGEPSEARQARLREALPLLGELRFCRRFLAEARAVRDTLEGLA